MNGDVIKSVKNDRVKPNQRKLEWKIKENHRAQNKYIKVEHVVSRTYKYGLK